MAIRSMRATLAWGVTLWLLSTPAMAVSISLIPQGPNHFDQGSGLQSITFDVVVTGLTTEDKVISAYDFGIGYDPALLTLQTWNFGSALGNPAVLDPTGSFPQVDNRGPDDPGIPPDPGNKDWNYQTFVHPLGGGGYDFLNYPAPGTPTQDATPYFEGSLRFAALSFLGRNTDSNSFGVTLEDLQHGLNDEITQITLLRLTFEVSTVSVGATEIFIIDDRNYLGFTHVPGSDDGFLDWKDDVNGSPVTMYLNRNSNKVVVPVPATLPLLALGLLLLGLIRQRM